MTLYNFKTVI